MRGCAVRAVFVDVLAGATDIAVSVTGVLTRTSSHDGISGGFNRIAKIRRCHTVTDVVHVLVNNVLVKSVTSLNSKTTIGVGLEWSPPGGRDLVV